MLIINSSVYLVGILVGFRHRERESPSSNEHQTVRGRSDNFIEQYYPDNCIVPPMNKHLLTTVAYIPRGYAWTLVLGDVPI